MDKVLILNLIKDYLKFKKDSEFAIFLGVTPQVLSNWKNRNTFDVEIIYTKCEFLSPEWLLTGKGEMLKNNNKSIEDNNQMLNEPLEIFNSTEIKLIKLLEDNLLEKKIELEQCKKEVENLKKYKVSTHNT